MLNKRFFCRDAINRVSTKESFIYSRFTIYLSRSHSLTFSLSHTSMKGYL